ncbi:HAD family phosphatase [Gordonia sp. OPL2]|uniref:HAD family hydrolase n=1 Tax=Gordonia sp. OPL2 TaxID=2486274 RepID=UPI0016554849|nr:HAD-IB family hydrolase [Gordonia sp. OPL2]ROZ98561.1 HAD-IB family hydrolase [Gordonia sp. OPL2]
MTDTSPERTSTTPSADRTHRVAAFFDLDKTVIAKSSALAFSRPFFDEGLINRRSVLKSSYAQFLFLVTAADHDQVENLRRHVTDMCRGWDVEQVRAIVNETLHDVVNPLVFAEAADLIAEHRRRGHDVVLISASGREMVEPIGDLLGVDHVEASEMRVVDGHYTGELEFYCYGENKAIAMTALAESRGYDLAASFAYSDSITDLPMLAAVGHPVAVNPDRQLRKRATDEGWPVMSFDRPVPLRARIPTPSSRMAAALAVGAGMAAVSGVGVHAFLHRRHRTRSA